MSNLSLVSSNDLFNCFNSCNSCLPNFWEIARDDQPSLIKSVNTSHHRLSNLLEQYRFVNNFDGQDDEEFQQYQLAFYKQEILNAFITNNRMDSDPESELTKKLGQYNLYPFARKSLI